MEIISNNYDKISNIMLIFLATIYLRILLQIVGQTWINTIAHTSTLVLLPMLTYVITSVISGNIALSLGMVGALSIVRFRNPVRSPLELTVYFGAITIGISVAVSPLWLYLIILSVTATAFALCALNLFSKVILKKPFFIASFAEGNSLSTLNVYVKKKVDFLDSHEYLISKIKSDEHLNYTLASYNFKDLRKIELFLDQEKNILKLELNR